MAAIDRLNGLASETTLAIKAPCLVATTGANITLSGVQAIDGVTVGNNSERVLVKDQSDPRQNGIYIASSGIWQYAQDAGGNTDWTAGTLVLVQSGATNAGKLFQQTTAGPIIIGTSNIVFAASTALGTIALTGGSVGPYVAPATSVSGVWLSGAASPGISAQSVDFTGPYYVQGLIQFTTAQGVGIAEAGLSINATFQTGWAASNSAAQFKEGLGIWSKVLGPAAGRAGAGQVWNISSDMVIDATYGAAPNNTNNFAVNVELDITNNGWDSSAGNSVGTIANLWLSGNVGAFPILAEIWVAPLGGSSAHYGAHYGLFFQNNYSIKDATVYDSTNSAISFYDTGIHTYGINLSGTYSTAQISGTGFSVSPSGVVSCLGLSASSTIAAQGFYASGDGGGAAGFIALTNVNSTTIGAGTGTVKMSSGNSANNAAWFKVYIGATAYWVPAWATNSP